MPPQTLPNLYTLPADVMDYLGTEATELRLDDHRFSSGQQVRCLADTAQGSTSLSVTALLFPILRGTTLNFDGGNMPAVVPVVLSATAPTGSVSLTVFPLTSQVNQDASARDSGVNAALAARLPKACNYGTSRVKLYCCSRYQDSDLATCWSANRWATALAAQWLCRRAGQPAPKSVDADCEEALEEMKQVNVGMLRIEDIGTRTAAWPFLVNTTVDIGYDVHKVRVEQSISDMIPVLYPQYVDWSDALWVEW